MVDVTRVTVAGPSPYDVLIGRGVLGEIGGLLGDGVLRVAVIHPAALSETARSVRDDLAGLGLAAHEIAVPDGEAAKTVDVAASCWHALGRLGFTRSDAVVAVGGGATTDLAGFVAATFLRGIAVVHAPTSLLGMVDAAIGGKTGINTDEGKNLVGSFHEPVGVVCDLVTLDTLSRAELVSGLAEVLKCGFIADPRILALVSSRPDAATSADSDVLRELLERAVRVKAGVVADDLTERTSTGAPVGREALNYGHTLGHAIERAERYAFRHGAAVSIGMVYAAELARLAGRLDDHTVALHRELLASVGLPTAYPGGRWAHLLETMKVDKKSRGDRLRFVILEGVARPAILEAPEPALLTSAYAAISDPS